MTSPPDEPIEVLLVEDNPGDARLITVALAEADDGAFNVEHVEQLASAIRRLEAGGIDVVLLDLTLPDSTGLMTLTEARSAAPGVPIIVLTGMDDDLVAQKAVAEGARDYVVKTDIASEALTRAVLRAVAR
jgi:CheY-like chemotaxis protein